MSSIPKTFDHIFSRYADKVPVNYMRALSHSESRLNPSSTNGIAHGLFQITRSVLTDFNTRNGTSFTINDLFDPDINSRVFGQFINRIVRAYSDFSSANMQTNWNNKEFALLVTAGHNSGHSRGGGVQKVVAFLESRGIPVTHENVFTFANQAGATNQLQRPEKAAYQRKVVDKYFQEGGAGGGLTDFLPLVAIGVGLYILAQD